MSRTCPGCTGWSGGTTSSPVEMIPTTGGVATMTSVMPSASSPPMSCGRKRWPTARIGWPQRMSSPTWTIFCPSATGRKTLDVVGADALRLLDHHDGVSAGRDHAAGVDECGLAEVESQRWQP
jgi:hypothetical protein